MQVCTSLQTDNHANTSPLSVLQAGCPSCRPTISVKALKASSSNDHANEMTVSGYTNGSKWSHHRRGSEAEIPVVSACMACTLWSSVRAVVSCVVELLEPTRRLSFCFDDDAEPTTKTRRAIH